MSEPSSGSVTWTDRGRWLLLPMLALLPTALHIARWGVDPPFLGSSIGDFIDAGIYLTNARELALGDDPFTALRLTWFVTPVHNLLSLISFMLFGVSVPAATLVSSLAAGGCVLLVYALARSMAGDRPALLAASLLALDPIFLSYALGTKQEMLLGFFIILGAFWLQRGLEKPAWLAAALLAALAAGLTKFSGFFLLGAIPFAASVAQPALPSRRSIFAMVVGFLGVIVFLGCAYLHLRSLGAADATFGFYAVHTGGSWEDRIANLMRFDHTVMDSTVALRSPLLVLGACAALASTGVCRNARLLVAILLMSLVVVGPSAYAPLRFRIPLYPLLAVTVARWLGEPAASAFARRSLAAAFFSVAMVYAITWRWQIGSARWWAPLAGAAAVVVAWRLGGGRRAKEVIMMAGLGYALLQSAVVYSRATNEMTAVGDRVRLLSRAHGSVLPVSLWCFQAALAAGVRTTMDVSSAGLLVLERETESDWAYRTYPGLRERAEMVGSVRYGQFRRTIDFLRVSAPDSAPVDRGTP